MKGYTAITIDIVDSQKLKNRRKVQQNLGNVINEINKNFKEDIKVKFSITGGDEFQGQLSSLKKSYNIFKEFEKNMYPIRLRFGVGLGEVSTEFGETTGEMDGECFINSRMALKKAKENNQSIVYFTNNELFDTGINTIIYLVDKIKKNWKDLHYRRVWLYEELGSQQKVAKKEKISQQMIVKSLKTAGYDAVKSGEESINKLLELCD